MTENSELQYVGIAVALLGWGIKNNVHLTEIMTTIYDAGFINILSSDKFVKLVGKLSKERLHRKEAL